MWYALVSVLWLILGFVIGRSLKKTTKVKVEKVVYKDRVIVGKPIMTELFRVHISCEYPSNTLDYSIKDIKTKAIYYKSCKEAFVSNKAATKSQALLIDSEYFIIVNNKLVHITLGEEVVENV